MPRPSRRSLGAVVITGLAAFVFLWQLGSSSFFVDEALTMQSADGPRSRVWEQVHDYESTPPTYSFILHFWMKLLGSNAEWAARLPSALAGIALVVAVWRLGTVVGGARAGYIAALLAAVSPLLFMYAQQARVYALAMLAVTVSVLAALNAERLRSSGWLAAAAASSVAALSLHYIALIVIAPLWVWVLTRGALDKRMRLGFCALVAAAWLAWLPLALSQGSDGRQSELGEYGTLTAAHAVRVVGGPYDDRYTTQLGVLHVAAAALVLGAIVWGTLRARSPERAQLRLVVGLVLVSLVVLSVGTLAGREIFSSRYMTFVAPLMLVVAGMAVAHARMPVAVGTLGVLLTAGIAGVVGSQRATGFYADTRGVVDAVATDWRPGDVVLHHATLGASFPLEYYGRRLPAGAPLLPLTDPATKQLLKRQPRAWIVRDEFTGGPLGLSPPGYRTVSTQTFPGSTELTLVLEYPDRTPARAR